ncbi:MAG: ribosome biogenesis GTPase Der [Candidatus Cloacimonadota bacterium]|jgi:GTP-binding protein|nr:ribosome biogenesis GTPase Der [Candidatus Cloacimonas sp.]MDD3606079.1 ribosome biogenesis GTPase Der [Candidatus Cloacimonas acidaminovorans]MDI9572613.1 ribosome biogenesis GTPase Der [Candidatus Cloacimonadota bacterium]OQC73060.1 MAG: GTPase Der [Candidatus Cloacimonetes bacterium ADurb.Bin003]MDD5407199.1 ribosome biogenesis GTPase Der [Candidatus Cloacimonas acidaminovorans]
MRKYIVSIVGRPNVGKSTLFNRLCRKRSAIVDFEAGITRDRKYEDVEWNGKIFKLVDTGGIVFNSIETIDKMVLHQVMLAIDESDLIIFMVDAQTGTTDIDKEIAKILYPHKDKVMLVANKADNEKYEWEVYDFLQLGFGDVIPISAAQGRNTGDFLDAVIERIPGTQSIFQLEEKSSATRIAVVGKPNVGKSSIVNLLLGNPKLIVTEIPGTTRDAIDSPFRYHNKDYVLIDTAGLRRKTRVNYGVEYFSTLRTIEAIDRCDIVVLVLTADEELSVQDIKIASYAKRKMKEIMVVYNKWDLIEKETNTINKYLKELHYQMPFLQFAPVLFISAKTTQRIHRIMETVAKIEEESEKRISTAELNRFMEKVIMHRPPTHPSGRHIKIYYITQAAVKPPTFIFFCNTPSLITENYRRYLHNQLREMFKFEGVSIKLIFKGRKKGEDKLELQ